MTGIAGDAVAARLPAAESRAAESQAVDPSTAEPSGASARRLPPALRTAIRLTVVAGAGTAAYFALRSRLPALGEVVATARTADLRWVVVAALAEAASIAMFAAQQRQLLSAFGVRMSVLRALAVTFSRSAIAVALPAGSAVSAGFAFQQYRHRGASRATATTVMILSALASTAGLALLYLGGLVTVGSQWLAGQWGSHRLVITVGLAAPVLVAVVLIATWLRRRGTMPPVLPAARSGKDADWSAGQQVTDAPDEHPMADDHPMEQVNAGSPNWSAWVRRMLVPVSRAVRDARAVPVRYWVATLSYAVANWLFDLVCLIAVARACHLDLGYPHLAAAYLAVQIVRQLPVTPGGIGLIETSLLAGLVSAGAAQAPATAVVLGYRLLSCWLIIPVGLVTWLGLRLPAVGSDPVDTDGRPGVPVPRDRRSGAGARALRRGAGRRLTRLRNSGPGGVRRPRQRQPH